MTTHVNGTRQRSPPSPPVPPPRRNPHAIATATRPMPPPLAQTKRIPSHRLPVRPVYPKPKLACTKSYGSATSIISSTSLSNLNSPVSPSTTTRLPPGSRRLAITPLTETQSMPSAVPPSTHHFRQKPRIQHAVSQKLLKTRSHDITPTSPTQLKKKTHSSSDRNKHKHTQITAIDAHYNPHKHLRKHFTENILRSLPAVQTTQSPKNTPHTPHTPTSPQRQSPFSPGTPGSPGHPPHRHFTFHHRSSSESSLLQLQHDGQVDPDGMRRDIDCICGRKMQYTQNPQRKYPPKALLYCQQNSRCRKQLTTGRDWFYSCKAKTSYHETRDGHFRVCYSCSISQGAKQVRIRRNHQLLIKQMKNEHRGKVLITKNTKEYILSSTSSKSKDETLRLLKQTYIEDEDEDGDDGGDAGGGGDGGDHGGDDDGKRDDGEHSRRSLTVDAVSQSRIVKSGWMMKTGNFWNKSFKKRYFQLLANKCLLYFKSFDATQGLPLEQRGMADLAVVHRIAPKGNKGFEVCTPSRDWKFLCASTMERDEWLSVLRRSLHVTPQQQQDKETHVQVAQLHKQYSDTLDSQTYSSMNPMIATQCLHVYDD